VARSNFDQELITGRSCGHSLSTRSRVRDNSGVTTRVLDLGKPKYVIRKEIERDWNVWNISVINIMLYRNRVLSISIIYYLESLKCYFKTNFDRLNSIT